MAAFGSQDAWTRLTKYSSRSIVPGETGLAHSGPANDRSATNVEVDSPILKARQMLSEGFKDRSCGLVC